MKRVSSVVWQFFDRLEENNRCVAVLCKLCDTEYKYFGNTTNLRGHLVKKHPIQWEFRQNNSDEQKQKVELNVRNFDDDSTNLTEPERSKYTRKSSNTQGDGAENSETEVDPIELESDIATINLVRQMHESQGSEEEWLDEDYVELDMYEPTRKRKIKREIGTPVKESKIKYIAHKIPKASQAVVAEAKDEYTVFGEYIANKLRKFKAPKTRGNIQQIITTILWQAEYGLYDSPEAVKRVLLSTIQRSDIVVEKEHTNHDIGSQIPAQTFVVEPMLDQENPVTSMT